MASTPKPQPQPDGVRGLHGYPPIPEAGTLERLGYDVGYWKTRARFAIAPVLLPYYRAQSALYDGIDALRSGFSAGQRTAVWQLQDGTLDRMRNDRAA
jgi:hypothetical protein